MPIATRSPHVHPPGRIRAVPLALVLALDLFGGVPAAGVSKVVERASDLRWLGVLDEDTVGVSDLYLASSASSARSSAMSDSASVVGRLSSIS